MQPSKHYSLTGFSPDQKIFFIEYIKGRYNIGRACKEIGITRQTYLNAMEVDPEFRRQVNDARESHLDDCEDNMFDGGKKMMGITQAIFMLKSHRRATYGEKTVIEYQSDSRDIEETFKNVASQMIKAGKIVEVRAVEKPSDEPPRAERDAQPK